MTIENELFLLKNFQPIVPVLDVLFSCFIVGPIVIIYWMSSWELYDYYLTADDAEISATISLTIGVVGQFLLIFYQDEIAKLLTFEKYKWINMLASKVHTLVYAQTNINLWRGMWKFIDMYSPEDTTTAVLNIIQNSIILMLSKTFRNTISAPLVVATDEVDKSYKIPTYFKRVGKLIWNK